MSEPVAPTAPVFRGAPKPQVTAGSQIRDRRHLPWNRRETGVGGLVAAAPVEYDSEMTDRLIKCAAWSVFAAIVAVTMSPIGLRPDDIFSVDLDRALAFMVVVMLFVLSYPRHFLVCALLLVAGACFIELLQFLSPTRHPRMEDALVKAAGAATGALAGWIINRLRHRPTLA